MKVFLIYLTCSLLTATLVGCNSSSGSGGDTSADNERPTVTGAISRSNQQVLVSFNEAMHASAEDPGLYAIVPVSDSNELGALTISAASLSESGTEVVLTTGSQGNREYRVSAVGVRDLAGNVIAQNQAGVGSDIDPASATFIGIPPELVNIRISGQSEEGSLLGWIDTNGNGVIDTGDGYSDAQGNTILLVDNDQNGIIDNWDDTDNDGQISVGDQLSGFLDSDLDGLQDSVEQEGWLVSVTNLDGERQQRLVTSDPSKADTDGDGLSDFEEFTNAADARNSDTDGDGLSDFREWNIIFSNLKHRDSDNDGLPDLEEVTLYFTSPVHDDTDGDGILDADEVSNNRNPRIADRPNYSIDVQNISLELFEDYSFTDETNSERSEQTSTETSISKSEEESITRMDSGVSEQTRFVEAQLEAGFDGTQGVENTNQYPPLKAVATIGSGSSWTDSYGWQADSTDVVAATEAYTTSKDRFKSESVTNTTVRNLTGGSIQASVDIYNNSNFTLTFSNIQISVLRQVRGELEPVATLSLPDGFGDIEISPLSNADIGTDIIFENLTLAPSIVENLMRDLPNLVFKVSNYQVTDNNGNTFASSDQEVFNRTAGIVFDFGDNQNAERYLVTTAGAEDTSNLVGGGWQGGVNSLGQPVGSPLAFVLEDIIGLTRHYARDTIEAGNDGLLDSDINLDSDDIIVNNVIMPGENGWLDTQPSDNDKLVSYVVDRQGNPVSAERGIIAGPDRRSGNSIAYGDDRQDVPPNTTGLPYGTIIISAGDDSELSEQTLASVDPEDVIEYVEGYQTSRTCVGNQITVGLVCTVNSDCHTAEAPVGQCTGPQKLSRVGNLRAGDENRDWFIFVNEDAAVAANFDDIVVTPGNIYRLGFLQDLDRDGLVARTELLKGSVDSAANLVDNSRFGPGFDYDTEIVQNGTNGDLFADSKDTDFDGLSDYAETKHGWKVMAANGQLVQVYPHPGLNDSDGDGLEDAIEMDVRAFCARDGSEWRQDALCAFQNEPAVTQGDAVGIIAGPNGRLDSTLGGDDTLVTGINHYSGTLLYGQVVILAGPNGVIDTLATGDDQYESANPTIPATHPLLADTDEDGVSDFEELNGYLAAGAIIDGGNGTSESTAGNNDLSLVNSGLIVDPGSALISYGQDQTLSSESSVGGDDQQRAPVTVLTDPLRPDSDGDLALDGLEYRYAGNPMVNDGPEYVDTDGDGLPDSIELAGWEITTNGVSRVVKSDPNLVDSDTDGLSDFVEYEQKTDPTRADSDGDGLSDMEEFNQFSKYEFGYEAYEGLPVAIPDPAPGWDVTVTLLGQQPTTNRYVSDPRNSDIDGDGLPDFLEKLHGTNPRLSDTDSDILSDAMEVSQTWDVRLAYGTDYQVSSDPLNADADGDGLWDFLERVFETDPEKANTDDDSYQITDLTEVQLGTDPLDSNDRCVRVSFERMRLDHSVTSSDNSGEVVTRYLANLETAAGSDKIPGDEISGRFRKWVNKGTNYSYNNAEAYLVMKYQDRVRLRHGVEFRDYDGAAWSPYYVSQHFVQQSDFDGPTSLSVNKTHNYSSGQIRISGTSQVTVVTDPTVADCK